MKKIKIFYGDLVQLENRINNFLENEKIDIVSLNIEMNQVPTTITTQVQMLAVLLYEIDG